MRSSWVSVALAAAVLSIPAAAFAQDANADVASELNALKARIADLEAKQRAAGQAAQSQATGAAAADAAARERFPQDANPISGWDKGFRLGSADGNYLVQPYVEFQFRNTTNFSDSDGPVDSNFVNGFEVRRLKVGLKGNAFTKDFKYNFRLSADRSTGNTSIDYAYGEYAFADDWAVRFGQFKLNWTHEETTSDTKQLAVERSLLNQVLGGGNTNYVQGVSLLYGNKAKPFRGELQFTDGDNSANTNYNDFQSTGFYQDFGVAARGEYKVFGEWDSYDDFTALQYKKLKDYNLLVIGGGADWAQGGDGDIFRFTLDAQYENASGLDAYASVLYTIADSASSQPALDQAVGGLVQVGYVLPSAPQWEPFARYSIIHTDGDIGGEDLFHEVTVGVNRYIVNHNAKFTLDLNWLPNGTPSSGGGLGYSSTTQEQVNLRAQIQLLL